MSENTAQNQDEKGSDADREMLGAAADGRSDPSLEKDPSEWVSGDDPITEAQKSYLDTLARRAGEQVPADITKAEASEHIDRLRSKLDSGS